MLDYTLQAELLDMSQDKFQIIRKYQKCNKPQNQKPYMYIHALNDPYDNHSFSIMHEPNGFKQHLHIKSQ